MLSVAHLFVCSLIIILAESNVSMHNPFYCYSEDPIRPQLEMLAIQTSYESIRGQSINPNVSSCTPSKFWMIGRHGTRLPNLNEVTNMLEHNQRLHRDILSNYDQGRTSICASDIELIKNWTLDPSITLQYIQYLTSAGWDEIESLAQRYQAAFPSILSSTYSPNDYFFRTTGTDRTVRSLHAFADGLFGADGFSRVYFENVPERDYLLNTNEFCPLYNQVIVNNQEQEEFREGPEYQEMTTQVSAKLGFHGSYALRHIEVNTLVNICKYEQSFNLSTPSPFCAFFSVANHQVLEYFEDLEFYYRIGYGHSNYRRLFENMGCFIMQDLLHFLRSNDVNDHKARIFSQNITILWLTLINLGAFEDNIPLTRHNFAQQVQRLFRTSIIGSKASNLAIIRYE